MEWIVQGLGIIALIICIISFFFKKKEHFLVCILIYNAIVAVQYILQGYHTEWIICILAIVKDIVFFIYTKRNIKPNIFILLAFEILFVVASIITWENWFSIFILLSTMLGMYGSWQNNMLFLRLSYLVGSVLLIINYAFTGLYSTILAEVVTFVSGLVSIYVYHIKKNKNNQIEDSSIQIN